MIVIMCSFGLWSFACSDFASLEEVTHLHSRTVLRPVPVFYGHYLGRVFCSTGKHLMVPAKRCCLTCFDKMQFSKLFKGAEKVLFCDIKYYYELWSFKLLWLHSMLLALILLEILKMSISFVCWCWDLNWEPCGC